MAEQHTRLSSVKEALEDIGAAGEAARLQLHLLSMQARQRTGALETSLDNLERKLEVGIEQAVQTASLKTKQLTKTLQEFLGMPAQQTVSVATIMTEGMRCCQPHDSLNRAAQIMWEADCGAVGVINPEGILCGIITDRDISMAAYFRGLPLSSIRVEEVMTREVHTCAASDSLDRAATLMGNAEVRRLPVTDSDGRALGMVSLADIARNAGIVGPGNAERLTFQLLRAVSKRRPEPVPSDRQAAE
jgi:CBS domain-containing protein